MPQQSPSFMRVIALISSLRNAISECMQMTSVENSQSCESHPCNQLKWLAFPRLLKGIELKEEGKVRNGEYCKNQTVCEAER